MRSALALVLAVGLGPCPYDRARTDLDPSLLTRRASDAASRTSTFAQSQSPPPAPGTQSPAPIGDRSKKPSLSVRATPVVSFSPARVRAIAELKGGPDDYEEYYCAGVEWDWGDLTQSESTVDCDPYEPGVSQITRRFSSEHVYRTQGRYRVQIRLKRNGKVLAAANTTIQVRAGLRDLGY